MLSEPLLTSFLGLTEDAHPFYISISFSSLGKNIHRYFIKLVFFLHDNFRYIESMEKEYIRLACIVPLYQCIILLEIIMSYQLLFCCYPDSSPSRQMDLQFHLAAYLVPIVCAPISPWMLCHLHNMVLISE